MYDISELLVKIERAKVVSFDVFDTLLLRPFIEPKDVFAYLSLYTQTPSFCNKRLEAEQTARRKYCTDICQDITFENIYEFLDESYSNFYHLEKELEYNAIQRNQFLFEAFEYAKKLNKKIIITSDMYFNSAFIDKLLKKNGFCGYEKIYVSSEYKKTKHTGDLYRVICEDLNTNPNDILHIGDNEHSDIIQANTIGIETFYFKKIKNQFFDDLENQSFLNLYKNNKNISTCLFLGLIILKYYNSQSKNYWYEFGYKQGGFLVLSFVQAIIQIAKCKKISDIIFVARDGFALKQIFDLLNKYKFKSHYVYASRRLRSLCLKDDYKYCEYDVSMANEYKNYIDKISFRGDNVLIVDSIALNFSSQVLLQNYLNRKNLLGVYLAAKNNFLFDFINLGFLNAENVDFKWDLIELLLTSDEPRINYIKDCKPVYINISDKHFKEEETRINIFKQIFRGEQDFIKDYLDLFEHFTINLDVLDAICNIRYFSKDLTTKDKNHLKEVKIPIDIKGTEYISMYSDKNLNPIFAQLRKRITNKEKF